MDRGADRHSEGEVSVLVHSSFTKTVSPVAGLSCSASLHQQFLFWNIYVYISVHSEATLSIFKKQIARQVFSYRCVMHTLLTHALSSLVQVPRVCGGSVGHAGVSGAGGASRPKGQRCWSVFGEDLVQLPSPSVLCVLVDF